MKRTLLFITCMLASLVMLAQEIYTDNFDYLPFVDAGKSWFVAHSTLEQDIDEVQYYIPQGIEEIYWDKKAYYKMKAVSRRLSAFINNTTEIGMYLIREENRKVYLFDTDRKKEYLMFDYSLKAGDTYETYSYEYHKMLKYKVLSVGDYEEGPEIYSYVYDEETKNMTKHRRYLRKWVVQSDVEKVDCLSPKTWIEGIGSLEGPFANLYDYSHYLNHLAFVLYHGVPYLPFTFHESIGKLWIGCNLPTGAENNEEVDGHHRLTYELEGDRLHVFGEVVLNCASKNNYAYFIEESTENPLVRKLRFEIDYVTVGELATCVSLFDTDFYVPGSFDPNINYIVVDNYGEEHPVINKTQQMAYRPFVEEGKVWKVGSCDSGNPVQWVEYFYFDGDTIIYGKTCKQMMSLRYVNHDYPRYDAISQQPSLNYVGAWYEEGKKVYFYNATDQQFKLMYDFSLEDNGTFQRNDLPYVYVVGPRQTGGMKGFKGVYRDVWEWADGNSYKCDPWMEGVGIVYGSPTTNICNVELADPACFLMSCTVGDEVIYLNDEYEDGATPEGARRHRFDFTHTIKTKPKSRMRNGAEDTMYGEYNDQQLCINLDPLDDAYQVRITDESGQTVYEKAIDAGNIVGLNIDISGYAEGRYTVTVENSQESFTGEFETHTTGIEEVNLTPTLSYTKGVIYNLHGQRLSTLQKGLNIVNGKKVFVK